MKQLYVIILVVVVFSLELKCTSSRKRDTTEKTPNSTETLQNSTNTTPESTQRKSLFRFDDGNIMEIFDPNREEAPVEKKEKGTHQFGRQFIKPFVDVASGAVDRIGKAFKFVTQSGLDTNSTFLNTTGGSVESFKKHVKLIYPGTRWCGDGDKAKHIDDLGTFQSTDKCCRAHDKCFDFIGAGESKYGLHNTGLFTRSHCNCDKDFYSCLKNSTDLIAKKIGFTYFSVLGPQCFKEEDHVTGCIHYSRGKCIEYRTDPSKGKLYQWFDSPIFIGL